MRPRRHASLLALLLSAGLVLVPVGTSLAQSLDEARAERAQLQSRLDAATVTLGEVEERVAGLEAEGEELTAEASVLEAEVASLQEAMQVQVVALFKRGSVRDPLAVFLTSDDPNEALLRAQTLERALVADLGEVEGLAADRRRLAAVHERLAEQREQVAEAVLEQREVRAALQRDLERAAELEQRLEAEERERQRRAEEARQQREREAREAREAAAEQRAASGPSGRSGDGSGTGGSNGSGSRGSNGSGSGGAGGGSAPVSAGMACPVGQPRSFTDTWGAARSGGRAHRGTDILAPYGTPVYAIVDGTWSIQSPGPSAGLWAILRGSDGNQYWYMHLQSHTVANGARVTAGQQTATNGDTGNARGTPHVHFELHPGGGSAINPYATLRRAC